jgi:hypothetical protein
VTDWPSVVALLITYKRTQMAVRTIEGVKKYLCYPSEKLLWHIADDGSPPEHLAAICAALEPTIPTVSNAERKGVGVSMNRGMATALLRADYILWLEDDWELVSPFDLRPAVDLLANEGGIGMVRLGYISPGISGTLVSGGGHLWWKLAKGETYTFTGHASLRHRRFCGAYGPYQEGLTPGETELYYCGTFNNRQGPTVAVPAYTGEWGVFGHIGSESYKDQRPE